MGVKLYDGSLESYVSELYGNLMSLHKKFNQNPNLNQYNDQIKAMLKVNGKIISFI